MAESLENRGKLRELIDKFKFAECERIISSIEHFYGHLEIECMGHLGLTSVEYKTDVVQKAM